MKTEKKAMSKIHQTALQMVTPAQSGRKHARVDWKGRYIKFRNEAQTVENESVIFLIHVIVTTTGLLAMSDL